MWKPEHFRICGYIFTLVMHIGNTIVTKSNMVGKVAEDPDIQDMMTMEYTYFTIWNIAFQIAYSLFGLYCDVRSIYDKRQRRWAGYMKFRVTFFSAIMWPSAMFIFTVFWPLFVYDRSLIFPRFVDQAISKTSNWIMHAGIVPAVIYEMTWLPAEVPKSHKNNVKYITLMFLIYLPWVIYNYVMKGLWPYPILGLLQGTIYFPLFFLSVYVVAVVHYYLQWYFRRYIWQKHVIKHQK